MGYKLAGYNHLGGIEIDKKVSECYKLNHNPKFLYNEDIRDFNKRTDIPKELYDLDILDGSPPCSSFSTAGNREKDWNKEKKFREGQNLQTLDDLVFVYCDIIIKLKPKVFILENVTGIIKGNAKVYSKQIVEKLSANGYTIQVFCLNSASMGVPQKRERVFFIGFRNELKYPKLKLEFNEKPILYKDIAIYNNDRPLKSFALSYWNKKQNIDNRVADTKARIGMKVSDMQCSYAKENKVLATLTSKPHCNFNHPSYISVPSSILAGTFPQDYNFNNLEPRYLIGMSVPPVMTAQISYQIFLQWFKK